jgi:hypothetical protein
MKRLSSYSMNLLTITAVAGLFSLCASCGTRDIMQVKQYHLRSIDTVDMKQAPMVRGEQMYRMRGAVSKEERSQRLGQYYSVRWENSNEAQGPLKIIMNYNQAATGSKVLTMSQDLPAEETSGLVEFSISGEAYRTGGRVLAWRIRMMSGNDVLSEKRSYMWK